MKIDRGGRREAPLTAHTGFSLLELLIVLAVIAGLVAIAWPNLRKPLGDTPLSQAAASLRELFDECRYQAVLRGELTMLRVEKQSSTVMLGSWEALLASQLELKTPAPDVAVDSADTDATSTETTSNVLMGKRRPPFQYKFALPPDIVVEQVIWSVSLPSTSENDALDLGQAPSNTPSSYQPNDGLLATELDDTSDSQGTGFWYVPFTPSGVSKDVSIILRDTTTQKRIALQHQQGTGLMTLTKLPDAMAGSDDTLLPLVP